MNVRDYYGLRRLTNILKTLTPPKSKQKLNISVHLYLRDFEANLEIVNEFTSQASKLQYTKGFSLSLFYGGEGNLETKLLENFLLETAKYITCLELDKCVCIQGNFYSSLILNVFEKTKRLEKLVIENLSDIYQRNAAEMLNYVVRQIPKTVKTINLGDSKISDIQKWEKLIETFFKAINKKKQELDLVSFKFTLRWNNKFIEKYNNIITKLFFKFLQKNTALIKTINIIQSSPINKPIVTIDTLRKTLQLYEENPITTKIIFFAQSQLNKDCEEARLLKKINEQIGKNEQIPKNEELNFNDIRFSIHNTA